MLPVRLGLGFDIVVALLRKREPGDVPPSWSEMRGMPSEPTQSPTLFFWLLFHHWWGLCCCLQLVRSAADVATIAVVLCCGKAHRNACASAAIIHGKKKTKAPSCVFNPGGRKQTTPCDARCKTWSGCNGMCMGTHVKH